MSTAPQMKVLSRVEPPCGCGSVTEPSGETDRTPALPILHAPQVIHAVHDSHSHETHV